IMTDPEHTVIRDNEVLVPATLRLKGVRRYTDPISGAVYYSDSLKAVYLVYDIHTGERKGTRTMLKVAQEDLPSLLIHPDMEGFHFLKTDSDETSGVYYFNEYGDQKRVVINVFNKRLEKIGQERIYIYNAHNSE